MSEAISHDGQEGELDTSSLIIECRRQLELEDKRLSTELSDADVMKLLALARRSVDAGTDLSMSLVVRVDQNDFELGETTVEISRRVILILAELFHSVRNVLADRWAAEHPEGPKLFHAAELPNAPVVDPLLPENISKDRPPLDHRVREYLDVALALEKEDLAFEVEHFHQPDPDVLQGVLRINTPATEAPKAVLDGIQSRLQKLLNIPSVHIVRSMKEWRNWRDLIQSASEADVPDIHALYQSVLMQRERLLKLDPRYATQSEFRSVTDDVRNLGTMFKPLRADGNNDEVFEGIHSGRIAIIREEPQGDAPDTPGELIGFYNVVSEPDAVRAHMKRELRYSSNQRYESTADLPRFSNVEEPTGEMRTISYSDEAGALRVFKAAANGTLAWSVDHAVRMSGSEKQQRYAMVGTALKMDNYQHMEKVEGKGIVLMKIATVIGADASVAASELHLQPVDLAEWTSNGGESPWNVDHYSGMVILPRAIVNVGSTMLNGRLGAHEVFTVTEEFMRDGIRIRILWRYLAQPVPPDIP